MDPGPPPAAPSPAPLPGGEPPILRRLRRWGLLLLLLASFLPYHGCRAHPSHYEPGRSRESHYDITEDAVRPATLVEVILRDKFLDLPHADEDLWIPSGEGHTDDGPGAAVYLAVPVWILLLGLAALGNPARLAAGLLAWCAAAASLAIIGAAVLDRGFDQLGPEWLRLPEASAILLGSTLLLAARPRHRWRPSDVEATVSGHALLGIGAALYWPMYRYLEWTLVDGHGWIAVMRALWENYRMGFWVGLAGLLLVAAPLHISGRRGAGRGFSPFPWNGPPQAAEEGDAEIGAIRRG